MTAPDTEAPVRPLSPRTRHSLHNLHKSRSHLKHQDKVWLLVPKQNDSFCYRILHTLRIPRTLRSPRQSPLRCSSPPHCRRRSYA